MQRIILLASLLAGGAALAACQQSGPTQKELFELRSQCAAFADAALKENRKQFEGGQVPNAATWIDYKSHYDAARNRCFLRGTMLASIPNQATGNYWGISLYDAQTHELLAICGDPRKWICEMKSKVATQQQVNLFQVQEGRLPKDLNELVGPNYISHLPNPPPNMRFDYNPATGQVKVVPK